MYTLSRNNPFRPSLIAIGIITALGSAAALAAGQTTRVSVSSSGDQGNGMSGQATSAHVFSADGRYLTFTSAASNLVPGDTNGTWDIFVRDRLTKTTTRVSVSSDNEQADGYSSQSAISADGRFVSFTSLATNLVPGDTNGEVDAFVHDRVTHKTTRVSVASDGKQGNGSTAYWPDISADGRFVTFCSWADNLVPVDSNGIIPDVFVHDRLTSETTLESVASNGKQGNAGGQYPLISADGSFVAFTSWANDLVPGDNNTGADLFVRDRRTKKTTRVSVASDGAEGNGNYGVGQYFGLSADGRFVSFSSDSSNLVPGDTNNRNDIFVHDSKTHKTTRVSVTSDGKESNIFHLESSISADGRFVAFTSDKLIPEDNNNKFDVFVHDRVAHKTSLVSIASEGAQGNAGSSPVLSSSADGRFVAFMSEATNLVPGDTNETYDVFVRDRLLLPNRNADIVVTQTESADPVQKGQPLSYTVNVKNNGPDSAADVKLTDLAPSNAQLQSVVPSKGSCFKGPITICRLGSLAAGVSATVQVNLIADKSGALKNTAYVNAPPVDGKPTNNTSNISTRVQ